MENKIYRFTDWYNEYNDVFGTYNECKILFNNAVKENPKGRYSIYDDDEDVGILYNKNCPEYEI